MILPAGQTPRAWQLAAVEAVRAAFAEGRRDILVSAATGTGKGSLLAALAVMTERKGGRCLLLSHRDELVADLLARVRACGGHAGRVQGEADDWSQPIVVGCVPSVAGRLDRLRRFNPTLYLQDEAHHALAPTFRAIRSAIACRQIGVTATPFRSAGRGETAGLGDVFEAVVYEHSICNAIKAGDLAPIEGRRLLLDVDLSGCDFDDEDDLAARFDLDALNAAVAADYHANHAGVPTVMFTANIAHAQHLAAALGPRAAAVWGEDPQRTAKLADFHAGDLDVLCNRDVLTEGWDAPKATVAYLAAPTSSVVRYAQCIGRITRLHPGKAAGIVVDCVGTTEAIEYVTWADLSKAEKDAEKREKAKRNKEAKERSETVGGELEGQQSYEVFIFGDAAARRLGVGWYEYQRAYCASAHRWGSDLRASVLIDRDGPTWVATGLFRDKPVVRREWVRGEARRLLDADDQVVELACGTLGACGAAGLAFFDRHGLRPEPVDARWRTQPASDPQLRALKAWGVRNRSGLSRGEASSMLDAATTRRKVMEWRRNRPAIHSPPMATLTATQPPPERPVDARQRPMV